MEKDPNRKMAIIALSALLVFFYVEIYFLVKAFMDALGS